MQLAADGGRVFVTDEARMGDGRRFRNTERLTARAGQVAEVEVCFGRSLPHRVATGQDDDAAR